MPGCARDMAVLQMGQYANQDILNIAKLEQKSLACDNTVTGKKVTSNAAIATALRDLISPYCGFIILITIC